MMRRGATIRAGLVLLLGTAAAAAAPPAPPTDLLVADHPWDGGHALDLSFRLSPDEQTGSVVAYDIEQSGQFGGLYHSLQQVTPTDDERAAGQMTVEIRDLSRDEPYWFRVTAIGQDDARSPYVELAADRPAVATRQWFDGSRLWLAIITAVVCGSVVLCIGLARAGMPLYIRKIAGLEAVEEAVGRATEMGRSCLFVPGVLDINDIQTIAGLTILSRVAQRAAEYDAKLEVPTSRSLVMTASRETVQAAYLAAGRPDAYNEDAITYVTDEQFGYVASVTGAMVREKPAACFYLGSFFAESLILAETGNSIGAIQVAGTAQPHQLPFFVAACDYTLIGEEFFAASAYLSRDPDQLGTLKGQDLGKLLITALLVVGVGLMTMGEVLTRHGTRPSRSGEHAAEAASYIKDVMLSSG